MATSTKVGKSENLATLTGEEFASTVLEYTGLTQDKTGFIPSTVMLEQLVDIEKAYILIRRKEASLTKPSGALRTLLTQLQNKRSLIRGRLVDAARREAETQLK